MGIALAMGCGPVMPEEEDHQERDRLKRELEERRARARSDSFSLALGESWVTDGDGIYRYMPEPTSLRVEASPPEGQPASHVQDDLEHALAPGRRDDRSDTEEDHSAGAELASDDESAKQGARSFWKRR